MTRICLGKTAEIIETHIEGRIVYAPVYMVMFVAKSNDAPTCYKVDLTGLR